MENSSEKNLNFSQTGRLKGFSVYNTEGDLYYKGEVERVATELRAELYPVQKTVEKKVVVKQPRVERVVPLLVILLTYLFLLVVIVASCFGADKLTSSIAPFYKKTTTGAVIGVSILDGLMAKMGASKLNYALNADSLSSIVLIVFIAAGVLYTVLALAQIIKALIALTDKSTRPDKRHIRFGKTSFLMLILLLVILLSIIFLKAQFGFGDFCSLIFPAELGEYGLPMVGEGYTLYSGPGLYYLILGPIVSMICSSFIYRK